MRLASLLAASTIAVGLTMVAAPASHAVQLPQLEKNQSMAETVGYRRYCWRWRHICADRWDWGTWRYRRCLRRHDC